MNAAERAAVVIVAVSAAARETEAAGTGADRPWGAGGDGEETNAPSARSTMEDFEEFNIFLAKVRAMGRVARDQRLADGLMFRRHIGHAEQVGRRLERSVTNVAYCNRAAKIRPNTKRNAGQCQTPTFEYRALSSNPK